MGMGHADDPLLVLPGPALGCQLLAGVKAEIAVACAGSGVPPGGRDAIHSPAIAGGPHLIQAQAAIGRWTANQQRAALLRPDRLKRSLENREATTIQQQL